MSAHLDSMTSPVATFLINMDRDTDRLAHMTQELHRAGLAFTRVPAVNGADLPAELGSIFGDGPGSSHSPLKPGEIGCFASHLAILRMMEERALPAALVLEDDLRLHPGFRDVVVDLLTVLPDDWDIVRLSNPPKRAFVPIALLANGSELVRYSKIPNNTGAYLISTTGARKFLSTARGHKAIDEELRRPWLCGMNTFGVVPPPVTSNIFDSTIDEISDRFLGARRRPKILTGGTEGPVAALRRAGYNVSVLGTSGWLRCLVKNAGNAIRRKRPWRDGTYNVLRVVPRSGSGPKARR